MASAMGQDTSAPLRSDKPLRRFIPARLQPSLIAMHYGILLFIFGRPKPQRRIRSAGVAHREKDFLLEFNRAPKEASASATTERNLLVKRMLTGEVNWLDQWASDGVWTTPGSTRWSEID